MQNTSHAVMAQRTEPRDSLDDFPTPPWATRAFMEHVVGPDVRNLTCLEPACGAGHMAKVLAEYFGTVEASDVGQYGFGKISDYLEADDGRQFDWIITNPPFKLAEQFIEKSLSKARVGVAMLVRTTFIGSIGRYERLFRDTPPSIFAQYVERVPMVKGRLDRNASTAATGYCWLVWLKAAGLLSGPRLAWIPPCRKHFEYPSDYNEAQLCLV